MSLNSYALSSISLFSGFPNGRVPSYAPSPVWRDSTTKDVRFQPLPKRKAVRIWHDARRFERETRQPGKQDGAIGRNGIPIMQSLLFDFLNYVSGALYPSYAAIAEKSGVSLSSVYRGLNKLRDAGVLNWVRRCKEEWIDGRFTLKQESNAYAVLPSSQWHGFSEPPPAPPPAAGTWGDHPPLPDAITQACQEAAAGGGIKAQVAVLESDERDGLAAVLARLGRSIIGRIS